VANGTLYDRASDVDLARLVRDLARMWARLGEMIPRAREVIRGVWADRGVAILPAARFVAPVWIGAGRTLDPQTTLIGPYILWDDPAARPQPDPIVWPAVRPLDLPRVHKPIGPAAANARSVYFFFKRGCDIILAIIAIALSLPLYPLIFLAIWMEDGRPFFFAHRRETVGGREFPCFKFRSMLHDAEKMKQQLAGQNQADGPQFFMRRDVRVTRVGWILRKTHVDELPQFFNVLLGQMSMVGPRPSPFNENQFCPAWREARLSVRPGITGLWQIKRTRRVGADFQEWIKYDIEYVEKASFLLDVHILLRTVFTVLRDVFIWRRRPKT
jgi:lipopolysaccharide/colanic/teichoic acid biosynthesis glycosyltransferase